MEVLSDGANVIEHGGSAHAMKVYKTHFENLLWTEEEQVGPMDVTFTLTLSLDPVGPMNVTLTR